MIRFILELIVRRTLHLLLGCIAISAVLALLCIWGYLPDASGKLLAGMCVGLVLYIAFNVKMMRRVYFLVRTKKIYFLVNLSAYFIFGLVNLCAYKLCSSYVFAWLFVLAKTFRYTNLGLSIPDAVVVFHIIMTLAMIFAPVGMEWLYEMDERGAVDKKSIPGVLAVNPLENKTTVNKEDVHENKKEENPLS